MENTSDFYKNRSMLKKCEKVHNTVSKVYCVLCALIMLASFLMIVMSISSGEVLKFAGIFLSAGAVWYLGVVGVYKKIDFFSLGVKPCASGDTFAANNQIARRVVSDALCFFRFVIRHPAPQAALQPFLLVVAQGAAKIIENRLPLDGLGVEGDVFDSHALSSLVVSDIFQAA